MNAKPETNAVQPSEFLARAGIIMGQQDESEKPTNVSEPKNCGSGMAGCGNVVPKVTLERCPG